MASFSSDSLFLEFIRLGLVEETGDFIPHFQDNITLQGSESTSLPVVLLVSLISFLIGSNVSSTSFELHLEVINLLIALFSPQLLPSKPNLFLDLLMTDSISQSFRPNALISALITNYIGRTNVTDKPTLPRQSSFSFSLFSSSRPATSEAINQKVVSLSEQSLHLLLLLCFQRKENGINPFRNTLSLLHASSKQSSNDLITISFSSIYDSILGRIKNQSSISFFYLLIQSNPHFLGFVLNRETLDQLVLGLLQILYEEKEDPQNDYLTLITLLMLTQHSAFSKAIQQMKVGTLTWFTERLINSASVSDIAISTLISVIQSNLLKWKDTYLSTNCLAVIGNISSYSVNMHPYTSLRMLKLFELISRKYLRTSSKLQDILKQQEQQQQPQSTQASTSGQTHDEQIAALQREILIYGDFLLTVFEIFNSILIHAIEQNSQFIYALLREKDLIVPFHNHQNYFDLVDNIEKVIQHFNVGLEKGDVTSWSVDNVFVVITEAYKSWQKQYLKEFTLLQFKYEEDQSNEFFVPFIWRIVASNSGLPLHTRPNA